LFSNALKNIKIMRPLVHNITNYVTVNDCANVLLSLGASPIMADDEQEVEEITSISSALVINIGTLNSRTVQSMIIAGKKANEINIPVVLDPVGAGASQLRTETALRLLNEIKFAAIRGNISEIKTIGNLSSTTRGVDADNSDSIADDTISDAVAFAKKLSLATGAVISITGAIDIVSGREKSYIIKNGHPVMNKVSGTGCMLSSITGAFAATGENILDSCAAAVCAMGICGEEAYEKILKSGSGTSSFKMHLIDYMGIMDDNVLERRAKIEIR
jgi:hydroxyethylthiazole kinase